MLDLAIIGSGPAALTAALYAARGGRSVEVFEREKIGGALTEISHLGNFPGFDGEGTELAERLKAQVQSLGVKISYGECKKIEKVGNIFELKIDDEKISARSVIVATGSEPKKLDFSPNIPVSYCALCDGPLYKGKNLVVIGGGNSAVGEAIYLAGLAKSLTLLNRSPLRAEKSLISELSEKTNVKIRENVEIAPELLSSFDAAFVFIGKQPASTFLDRSLLNEDGYIVTDTENQTSLAGLFAAGDVRANAVRQVVTAAADGAAAAISVEKYLKKC